MERFTLTSSEVLTKETVERMKEFAVNPVEVDEDCPELTDEQVEAILKKTRQLISD